MYISDIMSQLSIIINDDDINQQKSKPKVFHRRTQSNSAYDLNIIVNPKPKQIESNIEEIINHHNIIGSSVTLKALESAKTNNIEKQIIIDDIDNIPNSSGLIVGKKHTNPLNYIKKRNLTCATSSINQNTLPVKKIKLVNEPEKVDDLTGLNTIFEKRNSIDSFDPESMDISSSYQISKDNSRTKSKEYLIDEEDDPYTPDTLENYMNKLSLKSDTNDCMKSSNHFHDNKNKFIEELKKKVINPKQGLVDTNISPMNNSAKNFFKKSITPTAISNNGNMQQYSNSNSNKKIASKVLRSKSRSRLSISPIADSGKNIYSKKIEQRESFQMRSFKKYFSPEARVVSTIINDPTKKTRAMQGNSINSKRMISEKRDQDTSASQTTIQDYETKIESLKGQLATLASKSNHLEDQVKQLVTIIKQLTDANRELQQKQQDQELKIKKLENRCLDDENMSQNTRYTAKISNESDKKMTLKQDFSVNNILNTTDMSTVESPNGEKSSKCGRFPNKKVLGSPLSSPEHTIHNQKSSKLSNNNNNNEINKRFVEKSLGSYRGQTKKNTFEDTKKCLSKLKQFSQ